MRIFLAAAVSSLAALAVQPLVLFVWIALPDLLQGADFPWYQAGQMSFMAVLFASPFVLLLGVPLTLVLHRLSHLRWWPLALVGTLAAGILAGWNGPGGGKGFSSGGNWFGEYVDYVIDGEPTLYGWLSYMISVALFALHGLIGATVFYWVWARWMSPDSSSKPTTIRGAA